MVANRYAQAFFEVAEELNSCDSLYNELCEVVKVINECEELKNAFKSPLVSKEDKKVILDKLFNESLSASTKNFLKVMIDKNRMSVLEDVKVYFKSLVNEKNNVIEGTAITAIEMTEEEIKNLEEKLSSKYNKNVTLKNIVDETIIGGVLVRLGNEEIDGTVKSNISRLKENLFQVIS